MNGVTYVDVTPNSLITDQTSIICHSSMKLGLSDTYRHPAERADFGLMS